MLWPSDMLRMRVRAIQAPAANSRHLRTHPRSHGLGFRGLDHTCCSLASCGEKAAKCAMMKDLKEDEHASDASRQDMAGSSAHGLSEQPPAQGKPSTVATCELMG